MGVVVWRIFNLYVFMCRFWCLYGCVCVGGIYNIMIARLQYSRNDLSQVNINFAVVLCACQVLAFDETLYSLFDNDGRWQESCPELNRHVVNENVVLL